MTTETPRLTEPHPEALEELKFLQEETVITATRFAEPISKAPANIYVITDEDIRQSGAIDIPTLLRRVPGMSVIQTTAAQFDVSVRGDNQLGANKLLVMVDGRSIFVDVQGNVFWKMIPVTLPEIKRIEVLKGPASSIYGFNAFDGIVHIITKSSEELKGTTLQFGGGEFGTIMASAINAGTAGKLGYRLSIGEDQTQQWDNRDALGFRAYKFNLQTEYPLPFDSKVKLSGGLVDSNRFDGVVSQDTKGSSEPTQGYAYLAYERPNLFIRGYWNRFNDTTFQQFHPLLQPFIQLNQGPGATFLSDTYNLVGQHTITLGAENRLTYGVNYRHNTLSSSIGTGSGREDRLGLYFQGEWRPVSSLTLVAGLRYDIDTFINPTYSPRLALLYEPATGHTLSVSGAVAFRPPTIFEKNVDDSVTTRPPLPPTTTSIRSVVPLNPEQIISYQAGYQGWFLKHRLRARLDLFFNHLSDLISTRNLSPTLASPVNDGGSADIYGFEAGVEFLLTPWLSGFTNYAFQEINQTLTGRVQRGGPRSKFNAGLRGEWENGLSGEAAFHYVGAATYPLGQSFETFSAQGLVEPPSTRVGSYNLLNLRGGYRFWHEKAEVAVSAFNALNDQHKEIGVGDTIKSRVMGWLTIRL